MITVQGTKYLSDYEAKKAIVDIGKRMYLRGFVAANDGNISCRVGPNAIWATPTGVSKGFMTPEMLVKMDLNGKVLLGNREPSSEMKMHLRVYHENPEVMAVTHAHPPIATCFAIAGISLDRAVLPEAVVQLGTVPIAHYAVPGSQEVPDSIAPYCKEYNGVLLANHGALSWGKDIYQSFYRLESIEYYATILMNTGSILKKANELSTRQVDELIKIRENLGIKSGGVPTGASQENNTRDIVGNGPLSGTSQGNENQGKFVAINETNRMVREESGTKPVLSIQTDRSKSEIIAEVVSRVAEQLAHSGS